MASKKTATKLDITKFTGLDWSKEEGDGDPINVCDFCLKKIFSDSKYFKCGGVKQEREGDRQGFDRFFFDTDLPIAVACFECGSSAGLEW